MAFSLQSFPLVVANFLTKTLEDDDQSRRTSTCSIIRPNAGSYKSLLLVMYLYFLFVFNASSFNYLHIYVCSDTFFLFRM